jgi:diguanylate cyclase (GGDEF)-like protein/PAS domain S-box-containing protein
MPPPVAVRHPLRRPLRWAARLLLALLPLPALALPQHPLELRALVEPDAVRALLPALQRDAQAIGDQRTQALLGLAEANACRVLSAWSCQRSAAQAARQLAQQLRDPVLEVRAILLLCSALGALHEYASVEALLGDAERLLQRSPQPQLAADVMLAYSSLSYPLGRVEDSLKYARRGLELLPAGVGEPLRARLLRNAARAQGDLGQLDAARESLDAGRRAAEAVDDPKLSAELLLESAALALRMDDLPAHTEHVDAVMALAHRLSNRQLRALGDEARALGALRAGDVASARELLERARAGFAFLDQQRDELRVSLRLLELLLEQDWTAEEMEPLLRRFLDLDRALGQLDRQQLASDFEARLQLAQQQLDLDRLETEARLADERSTSLQLREDLSRATSAGALLLAAALLALFLHQRRARGRLQRAMAALQQSEARAHDLLRLSPGPVFLHDDEGRLLLINPAAAEALGAAPAQLIGQPLGHYLDETSQPLLQDYLRELRHRGEAEALVTLPEQGGRRRHWRIGARMSSLERERPHAVAHASDLTEEAEAAEALREQALRDQLTGCYNRRYLERFEETRDERSRWAAVNIDLDRFKQINDDFGHDRGDQVLREMAQFFRARLREEDALLRVGGDEFLILLEDADSAHCERLLQRLQADLPLAPCRYSVGYAVRERGESLTATLARADASMYARRRDRRARHDVAG